MSAPSQISWEDQVGGRVLAWVGGAAVALGIAFLLAIAVSTGWLGEIERTILAGVASLALLGGGVWAHGRRGRTDASQAAAAAGIAGLFATFGVASALYELVPDLVALVGSLAVGAVATALAVRWEARGIAALGILGALLAPAVVGSVVDGIGVTLLFVATAAGAGVLLWQRWTWLAFGTFFIAAPQWIAYLLDMRPSAPVSIAVLTGFGVITVAAAVGFELRSSSPALRIGSMLLVAVNAFVLAVVGLVMLETELWLVALAVAHLVAGIAARRVSAELSVVAMVLGVVLADFAASWVLDGLPLIIGWAATGLLFAALLRRGVDGVRPTVLLTGLGAHLVLALWHAFAAAPPELSGTADLVGLMGLAIVAAATTVSGRLAADGYPELRMLLDSVALVVLAYQTAIALDGAALTTAFAVEAFALALVARRMRDDVALVAAIAFAGVAAIHALLVLAPVDALVQGVAAPLATAGAFGAIAAAVVAIGLAVPRWALITRGIAAVIVLYGASVVLVTPFQPGPESIGQALLSALWGIVGVGVLVAGLVRDDSVLRRAALALLAVTVVKVFLFDMASLTSVYRAGSFVALGLLLLAGGFAWQRIRPRPLADLRTVPGALR